jgi:hypothetical protein
MAHRWHIRRHPTLSAFIHWHIHGTPRVARRRPRVTVSLGEMLREARSSMAKLTKRAPRARNHPLGHVTHHETRENGWVRSMKSAGPVRSVEGRLFVAFELMMQRDDAGTRRR